MSARRFREVEARPGSFLSVVAVRRLDRGVFHRDIRGMRGFAGIAVMTTTTPFGGVLGGCAR